MAHRGCQTRKLKYGTDSVNRADYIAQLEGLRRQIREDSAADPGVYFRQWEKADSQIVHLNCYEAVVPEIALLLPSLKQSVKAFYSENPHRSWAQQFALQDIHKLEELYPSDGAGRRR